MKTTLLTALLLLPFTAHAKPVYVGILLSSIPGANLAHKCQTCHKSGGPQLNLFGKDFAKAKGAAGNDWAPAFWELLKDLDSDQDGVINEEEILRGLNPGVAGK